MQNRNTKRPNLNTFYFARSGFGKSQALLQNPAVPHQGVRTFLFDPNEDHPWTLKFYNIADFKRAANAACKLWYSKRAGFRLAYVGEQSPEIHEKWCEHVLSLLDGRVETYCIDEEIAASSRSVAKADEFHGILMNQGRKFGAIYHGTTQKPTEVPKTVFDQCPVWWVGNIPKSLSKREFEEVGVENWKVLTISQELEFYIRDRRKYGLQPVNTQLQYKDPDLVEKKNRIHHVKKAA